MPAKKMLMKQINRLPKYDEQDSLSFLPGVNVMIGELNAGKTKWLQMIDYLLGDTGKPEEAFDSELAKKYDQITAVIEIDKSDYIIERRWKEKGSKGKIFINSEPYSPIEFSDFILESLDIPIVNVPKGNPYTSKKWPVLSFRELFRHMYKQERFWSDITQKQPDTTRSAAILQFLNKAENIYSEEYSDLVAKSIEKDKIEARKDVFIDVLQDVAVEVVSDKNMSIAITKESLLSSKHEIESKISHLENQRDQIFENEEQKFEENADQNEKLKKRLQKAFNDLGELEANKNLAIKRKNELEIYKNKIAEEISKFERARTSAVVFSDLKVTHCPACDKEILKESSDSGTCYVCGQPSTHNTSLEKSSKRIEFETHQLMEEKSEMEKLIDETDQNISSINFRISDQKSSITTYQRELRAVENYTIKGLPSEIASIDMEIGKLSEKLEQLNRVEQSLKSKDKFNQKITTLDSEINELKGLINKKKPTINFSQLSEIITDGMNTYINAVNVDALSKWKTGRVSVELKKDSFKIFLDGERWTVKAGGTANYILQIAYHYALFSLTKSHEFNYPGFLIIDFPPHFVKADEIKGSENYLLIPFIQLCNDKKMKDTQVIIAGRSFKNLEGVNAIQLS